MLHTARGPRLRTGLLALLAGWALGTASAAHAQDSDAPPGELPAAFTSDRPGFANTESIAALYRITTELGVTASFEGDPASTPSGTLPNLSLRAGVFPWAELRVRGPNAVGLFGAGGPAFGMSDPSVGFKVGGRVHETVAISTVFEASLPLGTDGFRSPEASYLADIQLAWNFFGPLTLTPNAVARVLNELNAAGDGTVRYFEGGASLKLTWQIIDVLGVFVQSYFLMSERSDARVQVGGGVMWMALPNVQIDLSFDSRVTEQGDPPTFGAGTTILW